MMDIDPGCPHPSGECVRWDEAYASGKKAGIDYAREILKGMEGWEWSTPLPPFAEGFQCALEEALARLEEIEK
jgi:hypothetical protein